MVLMDIAYPFTSIFSFFLWVVFAIVDLTLRWSIVSYTVVRIFFLLFLLLLIRITSSLIARILQSHRLFPAWDLRVRMALEKLDDARTFKEWQIYAREIDALEGHHDWASIETSDLYDHTLVKSYVQKLRSFIQSHQTASPTSPTLPSISFSQTSSSNSNVSAFSTMSVPLSASPTPLHTVVASSTASASASSASAAAASASSSSTDFREPTLSQQSAFVSASTESLEETQVISGEFGMASSVLTHEDSVLPSLSSNDDSDFGGSSWSKQPPERALLSVPAGASGGRNGQDTSLGDIHSQQRFSKSAIFHPHPLMSILAPVLHRKFASLDNPSLHSVSRVGTKRLIDNFHQLVDDCMETLFDSIGPDLPVSAVREYFKRAKKAHGCTALCLSGGGVLALTHTGIVRVLVEQGLLPTIISGTSGGSIIAAATGIRTNEEILSDFVPDIIHQNDADGRPVKFFEPLLSQIFHFFSHGVMVDKNAFERTCKVFFKDFTFEEAYRRTGKVIVISVTISKRGNPYPMCLSYRTSPEVLIYSAVCASCALPGLMKPVTLMAKNRFGQVIPYYPEGVEWLDGSIHADIPMARLTELFNVTNFITSQVNPHVVPFIRDRVEIHKPLVARQSVLQTGLDILNKMESMLSNDITHRTRRLAKLSVVPTVFGQDISSILTQKYTRPTTSEVLLIPSISLLDQLHLIQQPDTPTMAKYIRLGEAAVWPRISIISHRLKIELKIQHMLRRLKTLKADKSESRSGSSQQRPAWASPAGRDDDGRRPNGANTSKGRRPRSVTS